MSEYVPFGDEWKKHVAKLPKRELVEMLAKALNEKQETQLKLYAEQRAAEQKRALDAANAPANFPTLDRALRSGWVALATTPRK